MGYVHQGFWDAMGDPTAHTSTPASDTTLHIELSGASVYRTLISAVQAVHKVVSFLTLNMWQHVADPIDSGWMGHDTDIRSQAMYAQAENWIIELCNRPSSTATETHSLPMGLGGHQNFSLGQKRLYITGHSLGGALATIFLAKMVQSDSPLLPHFAGLYTYGQPRVGDETFSRIFHSNLSRKIFHHVYNNDIVPRVPGWDGYSTPPGTLVFITADYTITLYPPNANNEPVCVRPISFLHLSGLLNKHVIRRLGKESVLKILFRVIFPFFINDHFPSGYCGGLRKGTIHWTHGDEELLTFTKG
ncbi:Alpha/Beta hydrolase protein [Spinellus fusiger]|nr:Alpha/Beta hydrolase protein [Spinellus fusiger]